MARARSGSAKPSGIAWCLEDALEREGLELPEDQSDREKMLREIAQAGIDAYADE